MTIRALLFRFFLVYLGLLIPVGVALLALGMEKNSGAGVGVLIGAVMWSCQSFAKKNERYLQPSEKKNAVLGMIGIDVGIQMVMSYAVLAANEIDIPLQYTLIGVIFVGLLHSLVIWLFVGITGKSFAKQQAAQGK